MSGTFSIGGNTVISHSGAEGSGTVTLSNVTASGIKMNSSGNTITDSAGNNVLSESGSVVTITVDTATIGSNALVVDSSGKVGIGTNSPQDNLHIVESTTRQLRSLIYLV